MAEVERAETSVESRRWAPGVLLAGLGATFLAAGAATLATDVEGWYARLAKPFFQPPDWLFAPVWTVLYLLMAIAFWQAWRSASRSGLQRLIATAFGVQLGLNALWSIVFFGFQSIVGGFVVIVALVVAILATMWAFSRASHFAAFLLSPYLAWVVFATLLNGAILALN